MSDVNSVLQQIKDGKIRVQPLIHDGYGALPSERARSAEQTLDDNQSVGGASMSTNAAGGRGRRIVEIKALEQELAKITRRYEQAVDPNYVLEIKTKMKAAEREMQEKRDKIKRLESEQTLLNK